MLDGSIYRDAVKISVKVSYLAVIVIVLFAGCATQKPDNNEPTDAEIEQSVMTVNRLRHQMWGDKLYESTR